MLCRPRIEISLCLDMIENRKITMYYWSNSNPAARRVTELSLPLLESYAHTLGVRSVFCWIRKKNLFQTSVVIQSKFEKFDWNTNKLIQTTNSQKSSKWPIVVPQTCIRALWKGFDGNLWKKYFYGFRRKKMNFWIWRFLIWYLWYFAQIDWITTHFWKRNSRWIHQKTSRTPSAWT